MIAQARSAYPHLRFEPGDARDFSVSEPFDAVFSNAALHWIPEAGPVVACVHRALKPGGRFVAEFGGQGNVRLIEAALREALRELLGELYVSPWYFPSIAQYAEVLKQAGLEVTHATLFDRPTPLEGDVGLRNWLVMFAGSTLAHVPPQRKEEFLQRLEETLR